MSGLGESFAAGFALGAGAAAVGVVEAAAEADTEAAGDGSAGLSAFEHAEITSRTRILRIAA